MARRRGRGREEVQRLPKTRGAIPRLEEWVTATEAAEMLGITRQAVNAMVVDGRLATAHVLGKMYVVRRSEVEALARRQQK